ncbi:MAG: hypothetical protein JSS49_25220 [Planctomycetes bacterium]|nr:hypothetical protein [Planctomycetota bacterium]
MPGPGNANVHSLDALRDVRLALLAFGERGSTALGELRSKIDRTMAWLEEDRPMYWRDQERRAYDGVASTRIAYETCRMRTVGGRHSECIEEKVAFQRAKMRLEYCQQKIEVVRRWTAEARRQVDEYRGRSGPMQRWIDDELPNVVAMVGRMIDALEAYADIRSGSDDEESVSLGSEASLESDEPVPAEPPPLGAGLPTPPKQPSNP